MKNKFKNIKSIVFPIMIGVVLVAIPILYIQLKNPPKAAAGWFDDNWMYRKKINITYTGSLNLTEYQVLVENIDTAALVTNGQLQSDCDDLRFTSLNGTVLNYFIVGASCNTADTDIFVKTDSIPAGNAVLYMYYGNKTAGLYHNEIATFSYSTEKTVGYLLGDEDTPTDWNGAIEIYSLYDGNSITHNSTTVSLDFDEVDTTSITANDYSPITAKGLVAVSDQDQSEIPTPISWAGTEFSGTTNNGTDKDTFYIMNPWGVDTDISLYVDGTEETTCGVSLPLTITAGTGNQISCDLADKVEYRLITSDSVPVLVYYGAYRSTDSDRIQRPLYPTQDLNGEALFGYASNDAFIVAGPNGADYSYIKDTDVSPTTGSIAANGTLTLSPTSSSQFDLGAGPYKISSTTSGDTISGEQRLDGDGSDATTWVPRTEFGTVMGISSVVEFIAPVSDQGAVCSSYEPTATLKHTETLTSSNTQVYGLAAAGDFNTGNSTSYISTSWYMKCDKPTYAWWQHTGNGEKQTVTWPMMRQFTYPTPTVGTPGNEEKSPSPSMFIKFDEGSGVNAHDTSTNQNNGVITNASWLTTNTNCKDTNCLSYDGTGDYVQVVDSNTLDFNNSDFTLSGWIYRESASASNDTIIAKRNGVTTSDRGYIAYIDNSTSKLVFEVCDAASVCDEYSLTSASSIADDTWTYFTIVWDDDSAANTEIYLNGLPDLATDSGTIGNIGDLSNSVVLRIGSESDGGENYQGRIDEIKVYNYARSPGEIKTDYNLPSSGTGTSVGTGATGTKATAPVGWWQLDEQYGDSANASGSDLTVDGNLAGSGTVCPPTSGACPAWYSSGKQNAALDFDGGDYVEITDDSDLDFNNVDFSISGWVYRDAASASDDTIIAKRNGITTSDQGYIVYIDNSTSKLTFEVCDAASGCDEYSLVSTSSITDDVWVHFTVVWDDDSAANTEIYLNGVDDNATDTGTIGNIVDLSNARPLRIGSNSNATPADHIDGKIDEIKIFNVALTEAQVKVDYNLSASMNISTTVIERANVIDSDYISSLAAYWPLDENTGTTANDLTTNANTGSITAGTGGAYTQGKLGSGYLFNATTTIINAGSGTSLDNLPASGMTLSAWIYPTGEGENNAGVIMAKNSGTTPSSGWLLQFASAGTNALTFTVDGSTDLVRTTNDNTITLNAWNHVIVSWDGVITTASSVHIYVNGLEGATYATSTNGASRVADGTSTFYIGNDSSAARTFQGTIDHVKVFNNDLTPSQVAYEYNRGGPTAWWRFDECQGLTANDASGNSLTGTITAGTSGGDNDSAGTCDSGTSGTTDEMWNAGTTGKLNASLDFDDTNDYVSVTDHARLDLTSRLSISFWVNTDANETDNVVVSKGTSYEVGINADGDVYWEGTNTSDDTSARVLTGTWHHVTITNDETTLTYYVDGEQTVTDTTNVLIGADNATALYIGYDGTNYFDGQLDEVKVFNYVLSATQVKQIFNSGSVRFN